MQLLTIDAIEYEQFSSYFAEKQRYGCIYFNIFDQVQIVTYTMQHDSFQYHV